MDGPLDVYHVYLVSSSLRHPFVLTNVRKDHENRPFGKVPQQRPFD
jgi:hypothetical protein